MSADKRTPHTDALETLGKIHQYHEKRDAIHLGVEPVIAAERILPGQHLTWADKNMSTVKVVWPENKNSLGIADPFLSDAIEVGQRFWLIVYPREITSLRHVWEHPDFPASGETDAPAPSEEQVHQAKVLIGEPEAVAKETILEIAKKLGVDYDELMDRANDYIQYGEFWIDGGRFEGTHIPEAFWDAYETLTGTKVSTSNRYTFLGCSC